MDNEASLKSLENQVGQFTHLLRSRLTRTLPSDTEVAKGATHEQCKAITTMSSKQLKELQAKEEQPAVEPSTVA